MVCNVIDARMVARMFLSGARSLEAKKEWINELNVFPVPDGDTGTNMSMTVMAAAKEVAALENPEMKELCKAISSGSLRGARGNSGVILSQLFRGFTRGICEHEEINTAILADSFKKAVETAYKAVMKPKEGTILTVARAGAERAWALYEDGEEDLDVFFKEVIASAEKTLEQTPEMLPVLKQAGVVDSGGQGLLEMLKGAYNGFLGKEELPADFVKPSVTGGMPGQADFAFAGRQEEVDIHFGYCTEFIILTGRELTKDEETGFKAYLESIGDSIVAVSDDEVVKVHVHTNDPGLAIQEALTLGELSNLKIDNMRMEHRETLIKMRKDENLQAGAKEADTVHVEEKETGFLAVSMGEGIREIFKELGVDEVIEGGQTMNPSTDDILQAVNKVSAKKVFVLPNNKNIILAANQAKELSEQKQVIVIPSKTVPQGITAAINYVPELSLAENEQAMTEEMGRVKTGQLTYAVRDTAIDGKVIKQGDYMGIGDSGILSVGENMEKTALQMVEAMVSEDIELISIYYGDEVEEEAAEALQNKIADRYQGCDVELQYGGQPVYYYIISAE